MKMMLNEEQEMLQDMAHRYLSDTANISEFRRLNALGETLSTSLWSEMSEMGWLGVCADFGHVGAGVIANHMGRNLSLAPFISTAIMGATAFASCDDFNGKDSIQGQVVSGECIVALAIDEGRKHGSETLLAKPGEGDTVVLSGTKSFVLDGRHADYFLVAAEGQRVFWVSGDAKGISREKVTSIDGRDFANIKFDEVLVPKTEELTRNGSGKDLLERILLAGRVALASDLLGASETLFDMTVSYLKEREQFGRIIGSFQALQHRAAQLYTELSLARSVTLKAAIALDSGASNAALLASVAKAKAGEVAKLCANEAIQLHGGIGMTAEYDVGLFLKHIRVSQELLGDDSYHLDQVALLSGY